MPPLASSSVPGNGSSYIVQNWIQLDDHLYIELPYHWALFLLGSWMCVSATSLLQSPSFGC